MQVVPPKVLFRMLDKPFHYFSHHMYHISVYSTSHKKMTLLKLTKQVIFHIFSWIKLPEMLLVSGYKLNNNKTMIYSNYFNNLCYALSLLYPCSIMGQGLQSKRFFFQKATIYPAILAKSVKYWTTF